MRRGVIGDSVISTPSGASASWTAFIAAAIKHSFDGGESVLRRMWFKTPANQAHEQGISPVRQAG